MPESPATLAPPKSVTADGRGTRGNETRQALILAGLDLFGEYGVKGTTTRMLCQTSGANIAAINYHFEHKEGLYLAVAEYIGSRLELHFGTQTAPIFDEINAAEFSRERAGVLFNQIIGTFARLMIESPEVGKWARIIVREQANPTEAFNILYRNRMERLQQVLANLLGACTGLDPQCDEARIRVHSLMGQVLGFTVSREGLLRSLGTKQLSADHIATAKRVISAHVESCLGIPPLPSPPDAPALNDA